MPEELVTIATFPTPAETAIARLALEAEGIAAFVTNDHLVGMTWILANALGQVKVLVPASHAEQSLKTLEMPYDDWPDNERPSWKCADCGEEIDAEYEECWSCGAAKSADLALPSSPETSNGPLAAESDVRDRAGRAEPVASENPYAAPFAAESAQTQWPARPVAPGGDAIAGRAWRASVFGLALSPLAGSMDWPFPMRHPLLRLALSFYSVALLLALAVTNAPLSQRGQRCLVGAWVFNALAGLGIGLVSGLFAML